MKPKKSKKANLENFRTIFFQVGTILVLSAILFAFEWNTSEITVKENDERTIDWGESLEFAPITFPEQKVPEVNPPTFEIEIVDDLDEIEDDLDISKWDIEAEETTAIKIHEFEDDGDEEVDDPFIVAEFMPTFKGKEGSYFRNYVSKKVKFPEEALINGLDGTVYFTFVVDRDGSVTNVKVTRGVHPSIDNAVVKAIEKSPKWEPGMNQGKFVKVRYNMSVAFRLL